MTHDIKDTQSAIEDLAKAQQVLSGFGSEMLIREIPAEVQKQLQELTIIGPITSSGIEHVYQIDNRITLALFRLKRGLPADWQSKKPTTGPPPVAKTPIITPSPTEQLVTEPTDTDHLDFGPYSPK